MAEGGVDIELENLGGSKDFTRYRNDQLSNRLDAIDPVYRRYAEMDWNQATSDDSGEFVCVKDEREGILKEQRRRRGDTSDETTLDEEDYDSYT